MIERLDLAVGPGGVSKIVVVTGRTGVGKSHLIERLVASCHTAGVSVGGYYTVGRRVREFVDAASGARVPFDPGSGPYEIVGRFRIALESFRRAAEWLLRDDTDLTVIDEVGKLELAGSGLAAPIAEHLQHTARSTIAVVRLDGVERFCERFEVVPSRVITLAHRSQQREILDLLISAAIDAASSG